MAVAYMLALESEPSTYEVTFTALTKGANLKVQEWILQQVSGGEKVLEVGSGLGILSRKLSEKGCFVTAIDANPEMVKEARSSLPQDSGLVLEFQEGSAYNLPYCEAGYDVIVSTFMASELRPLEQQQFLRAAWGALKPSGKLLVAEEFTPDGLQKVWFGLKRWWYLRKLGRRRAGLPHPMTFFTTFLRPIGFEIQREQKWAKGSVRALELYKVETPEGTNASFSRKEQGGNTPGYYHPPPPQVSGPRAWGRVARNFLTGQMDHDPIEPGLYASGQPTEESPVIVTANYYVTFFQVMRDLKGIDAWVLCVDTRGINVWCAARGGDFGNKQLVEAIDASGLAEIVSHRTLFLPQLAAGGVALPELPETFAFQVRYGPIWSKDLPLYIATLPKQKPKEMRVIRFTLAQRLQAGLSHVTFILRKFLLLVTIIALPSFLILRWVDGLTFLLNAWISIIGVGFMVAIFLPVANFTRSFTYKGYFFGTIAAGAGLLIAWVTRNISSLTLTVPELFMLAGTASVLFWLGLFLTMSFSGSTMESSPRAIQGEYSHFVKVQWSILAISITLLVISYVWSVVA